MGIEYIIVQAGGKGTRLQYLTNNKPKCLVPINNLPMLFHLFKKFPQKKFIIIGDYHFDVLNEYLKVFAEVQYTLVNSNGKVGTLSGLNEALKYIPNNERFLLIWSDLILSTELEIPKEGQYIGISKDFECRWLYKDNHFKEERSTEFGVAGLFVFENKDTLRNLPDEGEFVRWLQTKKLKFKELPMYKSKEYGLLSEYQKLQPQKCRPFNALEIKEKTIVKKAITKQGEEIAEREQAWYKFLQKNKDFKSIPQIYSYEPFEMEKIDGKNIYEFTDLNIDKKKTILKNIIETLNELHQIGSVETDYFSIETAYYTKTMDRLNRIRNLVPFGNQQYIMINNKKCRNIFFYKNELEKKVKALVVDEFKFIHGDCTFSNILLKNDFEPILIDPRGYFGYQQFFGDPNYDWAKLYYSLVGNYDQFNLKRFSLTINDKDVQIKVESNGWEKLEDYFFMLLEGHVNKEKIKLLHAIIWLSLTTYAWEDYDSICGAFYLGLYYLEDVL